MSCPDCFSQQVCGICANVCIQNTMIIKPIIITVSHAVSKRYYCSELCKKKGEEQINKLFTITELETHWIRKQWKNSLVKQMTKKN
jgi:hypothetical protein